MDRRLALGPAETAKALGISENTLRHWMRERGLPYSRIGGRILIRVDELLKWVSSHREQPGEEPESQVSSILDAVRSVI